MTTVTFPQGVCVFFRIMSPEGGQLARSVHPTARNIVLRDDNQHPDDYILVDENDVFVALFPRDFVSAIMPLQTEGPGDVGNQSKRVTN
jgi:hypothetical protein